jgi:CCR4-NOT transcription complex subunit 1
LLLHLFSEVKDDRFREVMTKVLLERFIVHRPHPWGALVTFIELLRNPKYDFWSKEFIRIAPEVTLLLESVSLGVGGWLKQEDAEDVLQVARSVFQS